MRSCFVGIGLSVLLAETPNQIAAPKHRGLVENIGLLTNWITELDFMPRAPILEGDLPRSSLM
jgi:hypothetical protein